MGWIRFSLVGFLIFYFFRLPANTDIDLRTFFRCVFEKNIENRSDAIECLKLNFFQMYSIPRLLPNLTYSRNSSVTDISSTTNMDCAPMKSVDYQPIIVLAKPSVMHLMENGTYANVLQTVFRRFNEICGLRPVSLQSRVF